MQEESKYTPPPPEQKVREMCPKCFEKDPNFYEYFVKCWKEAHGIKVDE